MRHVVFCLIAIAAGAFAFACGEAATNGIQTPAANRTPAAASNAGEQIANDSPTGAYKRLYNSVKAKNLEEIKASMTKKTRELAEMVAARNKKPVEEVFENGFTKTTFSDEMPPIRDERVNGNFGAVEVWNSKDSVWEDLPFILEDGRWRLAVGDSFAGPFQSPGPGQSHREKQAANTMKSGQTPGSNVNSASNTAKDPNDKPRRPKQTNSNAG